MQKSGSRKVISILISLAILSGLSLSLAVLAGSKANSVKITNKQERIKKYFGKKGLSGEDYSEEPTAGVGGVAESGVQSVNSNEFKKMKDELYKDSHEIKNSKSGMPAKEDK